MHMYVYVCGKAHEGQRCWISLELELELHTVGP